MCVKAHPLQSNLEMTTGEGSMDFNPKTKCEMERVRIRPVDWGRLVFLIYFSGLFALVYFDFVINLAGPQASQIHQIIRLVIGFRNPFHDSFWVR